MVYFTSAEQWLERLGLSKKFLVGIIVLLNIGIGLVGIICYQSKLPVASVPTLSEDELGPSDMLLRRLSELGTSDPKQELVLRMSAANILREQGKYADAAVHFMKSQDLASRLGDDEQLVEVWMQLSAVRLLQGHMKDALALLEKAFDFLHTSATGSMHGEEIADRTASVLQALGNVKCEMGHVNDAIETYGRAWDARTTAPNYHERISKLLSDIGDAYLRVGMPEQASDYLHQALQSQESVDRQLQQHGVPEELDAATVNSLLAQVQSLGGNAASASELCNKALRVQEKHLRPGHPDLIRSRMLAARLQRDLGNGERALQGIEGVEKTVRVADPESLQLSRVLIDKADLLRELGQLPQAEASIKAVFALPVMGSQEEFSPDLALAHQTFGSILQDQGRREEASTEYIHALMVNEKTVGHWHPQTAAAHNSLGTLSQDLHKYSEAREHFEACLDIQLRTAGASSPDVASTYSNIATIMFQEGDHKGAAELLRRALSLLDDAKVPQGSPDRDVYASNLRAVLAESPKAFSETTKTASAISDAAPSATVAPTLSLA